jgi:RNA polymerase sigma-70 factor (ECF subfamily)
MVTLGREGGVPPDFRKVFRTGPLSVFSMATFEELYHQHVQAVFRFALSVAGRREVAEDLTSEAFLALHKNLESIDQTQLPGWLLTVVRNRARDWWRRQAVELRYAERIAERRARVEEPAIERWILESGDLKPIHRSCVMLRYVYGMTRAEIARQTGLSETQVKGHLQYALTLLRKAHGVRET